MIRSTSRLRLKSAMKMHLFPTLLDSLSLHEVIPCRRWDCPIEIMKNQGQHTFETLGKTQDLLSLIRQNLLQESGNSNFL